MTGLTRLTGFMGHDNPDNPVNPVRKKDGRESKIRIADQFQFFFLAFFSGAIALAGG
ncbi:MAG: hypothetical protein HQK60_05025 [Deltaproteobacteria bacterium]|nr:hypothetical protein [Deltaproteobacteria bacterium]